MVESLRRRGMVVEVVRAYRGLDTMKLTGLIVDAITTWHPDHVYPSRGRTKGSLLGRCPNKGVQRGPQSAHAERVEASS